MEGKGVLFKRFADIDVFDIELDTEDPDEIIETVASCSSRPSAASTSRTSRRPSASRSRRRSSRRMKIPVFHDDQHGTAIISGAALLNALELAGKKIDEVKVVFSGAGAAGDRLRQALRHARRAAREHRPVSTRKGVIYKGRTEDMNPYKDAVRRRRPTARTLADALRGADVFVGALGRAAS